MFEDVEKQLGPPRDDASTRESTESTVHAGVALARALPIAIVGIGCRLPGNVSDPDTLWRLLHEGVDVLGLEAGAAQVTRELDDDAAVRPTRPGFLDAIDRFDHEFFGISHREATIMDPQQRLLLETAWDALEDGGLVPRRLAGTDTGVFWGIQSNEYAELQTGQGGEVDPHLATGGSRNAAAGRISFALGLHGPSLVVDSDRSSSLVAVHLACQSLRSGECTVALVGGANLILTANIDEALRRAGMLAADGRCKFGDADADGIVRSEGVVVLVLRPLADALRHKDRVYAVIRGSAVMSAGNSGGDLMTPSAESQERLLRAAYRNARVSPGLVQYVEAHGTGTPTGDAVELAALGAVLAEGRPGGARCAVGSAKTNFGHTEAAAGVLGLAKAALALHHRLIPPSLHLKTPSSRIPFAELPLTIATSLAPLSSESGLQALAGVSAFGLTGTNAHVVLEAPPAALPEDPSSARAHLLVVSGKTRAALDASVSAMVEHLEHATGRLDAICRTAAVHRSHHVERVAVVGASRGELARELKRVALGEPSLNAARGRVPETTPKIAFVFPGQGSQWRGMGQGLFASEPVFREAIERCDEAIRKFAGWSLVERAFRGPGDATLDDVDVVQPTLVAVSIALASLWTHWGVRPDAVVGASLGELAAAQVAGVLSLEDALFAVCSRSRLMRAVVGRGTMAEIDLSAEDAAPLMHGLEDRLAIAASNGPMTTVLSGDAAAMHELRDRLAHLGGGVTYRPILADVAGHSPIVEPLIEAYRRELSALTPRAERTRILSTLHGSELSGTSFDAAYWARQMRAPVLLHPAVDRLVSEGYGIFLEVSPHPILWPSILETIRARGASATATALRSLVRDRDETRALYATVGALHVAGVEVNHDKLQKSASRATLPRYPWQRKRCWFALGLPAGGPPALPADAKDAKEARPFAAAPKDQVRHHLGRILSIEPGEIDPRRPFRELGLTSLMATELRLALEQAYGLTITPTAVYNYPTVERLAAYILERTTNEAPAPPPARANGHATQARTEVEPVAATAEPLEPIAIVGMACRFPGCSDPASYWRLLENGVDAIREVPAERWDAEAFFDADPEAPGKMHTRWGGFVEDAARFDGAFFGISPREAEAMDPQQRLLLEITWEALENANIDPTTLLGKRGGVFVGLQSFAEYARYKPMPKIGAHDPGGDSISIATGRIAYTLGLQGPAVSIDTACSGSLVGIHYASMSLRKGETDLALAGGVNVITAPEVMIALSKARMLSPRGRCRTFDASADGYVRSEGCGVLVLKRAADAVRDGDRIWALLRSTSVNQDGRSAGLTAPSGLAQQALLREALAAAGLRPKDIAYLEAHGTGTPLGDPIELQAVEAVLGEGREPDRPLQIGSVKTNIGHLESAAGIAGLMKVVLALEHEKIPPHLHLGTLNPAIGATPNVRVTTELTAWPDGAPRIGAVSSFGFSGTNAHAILERGPAPRELPRGFDRRPLHVLMLSAKGEGALRALASRYVDFLERTDAALAPAFADVAYTSQTRRAHLHDRLAVVAADAVEAGQKLKSALADPRGLAKGERLSVTLGQATERRLAFLFTGQGSHYPAMGKQLFETEPVFRRTLQRCGEVLFDVLDRPLETVLYGQDETLRDPTHAQVALFALEVSLYEMWRAWGVVPSVLMGHSLGEYAVAYAAGVMTLEDALRLVALRGPLGETLPDKGQAAAVWAAVERVAPIVAKSPRELAIAAINAPERLLVTGTARALAAAVAELEQGGVQCKLLQGLIAVHSPLMEPMLDPFEAHVRKIKLAPARLPVVSSVTGKLTEPEEMCDPLYWRRHIREPVRFAQAMLTLHELGANTFLEIGPHQTLIRLGQECLPPEAVATWHSSLQKERAPWEEVSSSLSRLWTQGTAIDLEAHHRGTPRRAVALPNYAWQGGRYWVDVEKAPAHRTLATHTSSDDALHPLVGERVRSPLREVQLAASIDASTLPFLKDHRLWRTMVVPGALHLERTLAAARDIIGLFPAVLEDVVFSEAIVLGREDETRTSHLVFAPAGEGAWSALVTSVNPDIDPNAWRTHLTASLRAPLPAELQHDGRPPASFAEAGSPEERLGADMYAETVAWGYGLGPAFQWMAGRLPTESLEEGEAWFHLEMPPGATAADAVVFHPALIDTFFQLLIQVPTPTRPSMPPSSDALYVPTSIKRLIALRRPQPGERLLARVYLHPCGPTERLADVSLYSAAGLAAEVTGIRARLVPRETLFRAQVHHLDDAVYRIAWSPAPQVYEENETDVVARAGSWLVVADADEDENLGGLLSSQLEDAGESCVVIDPRAAAELDDPDAAVALLRRVMSTSPLRGVVYVAGDGEESEALGIRHASQALHLAQALATLSIPARPRLWLVTRGAQAVVPTDRPSLAGALAAPLWGLGRTIATELPAVWGGLVDLGHTVEEADVLLLFEHLWRPDDCSEAAFRGGERLAPRLEPAKADRPTDVRPRGDATYVLTGGLGALGIEIARTLVARGARHLVLLARRPPGGSAARAIAELGRRGATVTVVHADVARAEEVEAALGPVLDALPPVKGVIHAAGVLADALVQAQTRASFADVFAPKIAGALVLHRFFERRREPLDFFVHFSSIAALLGNDGQANYAAANAFLDAFALVQKAAGVPATSVAWGPWGGASGMAGNLEDELHARWGLVPIAPRLGSRLLLPLLGTRSAHLAVMPCDWLHFGRRWGTAGGAVPALFADVVKSATADGGAGGETERAGGILERLAATPPSERREVLLGAVRTIVADILGLEPQVSAGFGTTQRLEELGVDSLLSMAVVRALQQNLRVILPKNAITMHPTLDRLIDYLLGELEPE